MGPLYESPISGHEPSPNLGPRSQVPTVADQVIMKVTSSERRHSRGSPRARLRPGVTGSGPELEPGVWYDLRITQSPNSFYVWLETPHGAIAWQRDDLELRGGDDAGDGLGVIEFRALQTGTAGSSPWPRQPVPGRFPGSRTALSPR